MSNQRDQSEAQTLAQRISAIRERVAQHDDDDQTNERRMDGPQFEKWGKDSGPMPWKQEQWNKLVS